MLPVRNRLELSRTLFLHRITIRMSVGFLVVALLSGCMSPGRQLDRSAIQKLQRGQTQAYVQALFGDPKRTELGADGRRLDFYQIRYTRKLPEPHRAFIYRTLCVLYDGTNQVADFSYHVGELAVWETNMGWEAGRKLDEAVIRGIQPEMHSHNDVMATLGPPTIEGLDQDGNLMMCWYFIRGSGGLMTKGQELLVKFDSTNRVKDYRLRELKP